MKTPVIHGIIFPPNSINITQYGKRLLGCTGQTVNYSFDCTTTNNDYCVQQIMIIAPIRNQPFIFEQNSKQKTFMEFFSQGNILRKFERSENCYRINVR